MKKISLILLTFIVFASLIWADGVTTSGPTLKEKFFAAVKRGDTTYVKSALDSKTNDINETNADGQTPLMIAVDNQDLNMVLLLVQYKPDINKTDKNGKTAKSIAAEKGNLAITNAINSL